MEFFPCFADTAKISTGMWYVICIGIVIALVFTYAYFCVVEMDRLEKREAEEMKQRKAVEELKPQKGDANGESES